MTLEQGLSFLIFSFVAAVTPGPSNVMLTATGAMVGVARGLPCLLGVAVGMGALLFAAALGLGQVVLGHPRLMQVLNWGGAAFLLWLAWKIATAEPASQDTNRKAVGFVEAATFQWINPKSWMVGVSAAGTYLQTTSDSALLYAVTFAAIFVAAALPSSFLWLAFGASMHRLLRSTRAARIFNIVMGVSLAASVAMIL
ncbi:LysE family translocator [Reyranella sp. CPCC 100927]|uniref:LysE family translocator n=1 Tax=Reyranella sp. CPCC 100927 TaxID=2599616 RepID=UPI0011B6860D|nr:LysE family translocator [Reyranella sp. CPCC 100927]TWT15549.1 LysE family translocator [Reyranella sp. CPCC 100927]